MTYDKGANLTTKELWREDTQHRDSGGYNLVLENLPTGAYVPKGTPLKVDTKKRTATVCVRVRVVGGSGTNMRVSKGSLVKVGDTVAEQNVDKVDATNSEYDVLTLAGAGTFKTGDVLSVDKNVPNRLSYSPVKIEAGAVIDAVNFADEVEEDKLSLTQEDKEALGARFLFV